MRLVLPRLYVILDAALIPRDKNEMEIAARLAEAGVRLLQYRNKKATARELLAGASKLASALTPLGVSFLVNDRPDVAALSGADGVHVGQEDLQVESARRVVGADKWVGVSTHNLEQFEAADSTSADYIAVGPIFSTSSKGHPDPLVGVEFVRQVRGLTDKPIVAIGGISLEHAADVLKAGADSVAVISGILSAPDPAERARQYLKAVAAAPHAGVL